MIEPETELVTKKYFPKLTDIKSAAAILEGVAVKTPLILNQHLSEKYNAKIYLKREDLQVVRSYKIRGAYNKIYHLNKTGIKNGVVCASAGNHAQGVAYSCNLLKLKGVIFMPTPTPKQKVDRVKMFGNGFVEIVIVGDTFDEAQKKAFEYSTKNDFEFVHPFDDPLVIEGQGTVGLEILEQTKDQIDFLFLPVGGGGLASGVSSVFKVLSSKTKLIGVEPNGAPSMSKSFDEGKVVTLESIDRFVDGAAVQKVGDLTFEICKSNLDKMITVNEGEICSNILKLYNEEAIVVEPAGALSVTVLSHFKNEIKGKTVICVLSGNNNDITRTEEIRERSLLYEGLKHYFIIRFPQRAGALKEFVNNVLGPTDDISYFEYAKKNNRERGPAVVGLELQSKNDFDGLISRMKTYGIEYDYLNERPDLFQLII
ncbi:MAG: threonine ammonia-lyase [Ignavibacteriales bacterium]|nr:threonine ammonia-lyase [Ignavibacteriales bacterium]